MAWVTGLVCINVVRLHQRRGSSSTGHDGVLREMARQEVDDLTSRLRRIHICGEIVGDIQLGFVGRPVEVTIEPQVSTVRILEGVQVEDNAGVVTIAPFVRSALAKAQIGRQPFGEPGTRVLSYRAIEYWARGGGFVEGRGSRTDGRIIFLQGHATGDLSGLRTSWWRKTLWL